MAFNLLQMKLLHNKSFDEQDTFQCHLLQPLKITSYSAPFLNSKRKNGILPQHNLERDQLFQLFSISWFLQKKVNEGVYLLELIIMLIIKETFSSKGHFTHALCSRTGSINVFLYAIGSRGVGRIRDGNGNPRRCFGFD